MKKIFFIAVFSLLHGIFLSAQNKINKIEKFKKNTFVFKEWLAQSNLNKVLNYDSIFIKDTSIVLQLSIKDSRNWVLLQKQADSIYKIPINNIIRDQLAFVFNITRNASKLLIEVSDGTQITSFINKVDSTFKLETQGNEILSSDSAFINVNDFQEAIINDHFTIQQPFETIKNSLSKRLCDFLYKYKEEGYNCIKICDTPDELEVHVWGIREALTPYHEDIRLVFYNQKKNKNPNIISYSTFISISAGVNHQRDTKVLTKKNISEFKLESKIKRFQDILRVTITESTNN